MEIGSLADWFSAFGTIAACVIALRIARREDVPKILTSSSMFLSDGEGGTSHLYVGVRNAGYQPIHVSFVMLKIGLFRPRMVDIGYFVGSPEEYLEHGDELEFRFVLSQLCERAEETWSKRPFAVIECAFARAFSIHVYLRDGRSHNSELSDVARRYLTGRTNFDRVITLPDEELKPRLKRALRSKSSDH